MIDLHKIQPQPLGHHLCIPFMASFLTDKSLNDFFNWHYYNGYCYSPPMNTPFTAYFTNYDLEDFCELYGIKLKFFTLSPITESVYDEYVYVCAGTTDNVHHVIYWDGLNLYDPNYCQLNYRPLSDYKILQSAVVIRSQE